MTYKKHIAMLAISILSKQAFSQNMNLEKTQIKSKKTSTQSVTTIDAQKIDQELISNITDSVRHIPGVQAGNTGGRFGSNGFNIRGIEGDAIAITVDGLAQGETLSPPTFAPYGMFGANRNTIELETVKLIKIVKGPNSVISGSGALGGSVAYTTKDPEDFLTADKNFAGKIKAGYDSRSEESLLSTSLAGRLGKVDSLLIYTVRDGSETEAHDSGADELGPSRGQKNPADKESESVLFKLLTTISDRQLIGLVYELTERDNQGLALSRDSAAYYDFATSDQSDRDRIGLFYELSDAQVFAFDNLEISLDAQELLSHGETAFSYDPSFGTDGDPSNDYLRIEDRSYHQESTNLTLAFEKNFGNNMTHALSYGITYEQTSVENELYDIRYASVTRNSEQTQNLRDPSWIPETDKTIFSAYFLDIIDINEQLSVNAGVRYDDTQYEPTVNEDFVDPLNISVSDSQFSAAAYQLGIDYTFIPNHTLSVRYGQGYKAPTTQELYLDTNSGANDGLVDTITGTTFDDWDVLSNPELEAEESTNVELTYLWDSENAQIKLTAFSSDYENMIVNVELYRDLGQVISPPPSCSRGVCTPADPTSVDVYTQAQNLGELSIQGVELESKFRVTKNLLLSLTYSTIEKGDELYNTSPDSAVLGLSYSSSNADWGVASYLTWTDAKDENNTRGGTAIKYPDSSTVLDLSAYYHLSSNVVISAAIHNATNEDYARWEVVKSVREGSGGFFSGVDGDGIDRYSEPGRNASLHLSYLF
ncbi:MAG: TonB-dependent hemoglobin/transferrin/lactoferrin family receptor [Spongiibacteraceae bacterium]|nr:TonB-dependent hemoglobin/transferrin/lactoferrin family receptor [Spongiibacteraceae bacterium]